MIKQNLLYILLLFSIIFCLQNKNVRENYSEADFNEKLQPLELRQIRELDKFFVMENFKIEWILIERIFTESDRENSKAFKRIIDDINDLSKYGITLLTSAAQYGKKSVVKYLLANGADPNKLNINGTIALHKADNKAIVLMLKESGSNPNHKDSFGNTPLISNAYKGRYETILGLLESGASINFTNKNGVTALMQSTHYDTNVTKLLLENNALIYKKDKDGNTALHYAAKYGSINAIKDLIKAGAKPNEKNNNGDTPILLSKDEFTMLTFINNRKKWEVNVGIQNNNRKTIKNLTIFKNYKSLKSSLNIQKFIIIFFFIALIIFSIIFIIKKGNDYGNVDYESFGKKEMDDIINLDLNDLNFLNKDKI